MPIKAQYNPVDPTGRRCGQIAAGAGFRRSLPPSLLTSLAGLLRAMTCYYSNLTEGQDTHPVDIKRALKNDYSQDAHQ